VPAIRQPVGYGGLGQAAQTHRSCLCDGLAGEGEPVEGHSIALAVPMVKGPRLVGVVEILLLPGNADPAPELLEMLEAMAAQAATSIDAAILYEIAESLSLSDPLTGLANRRQLGQDLTLEIERAARYHRPLSFLMIDIDRFKVVNDTFGHAVGDAVLVEVASVLHDQMRLGDTIYRYGGEEFGVLARETDLAGAQSVAERLRRVVEDRYASRAAGDVAVTISVGVAELSDGAEEPYRIVRAADEALYAAKRTGRNRVVATGAQSRPAAADRVRIVT
jgi:diguanylate cyclase (GGDEF)-like protein